MQHMALGVLTAHPTPHPRSTHTQQQPVGWERRAAQSSSASALSAKSECGDRGLQRMAAGGGEWLCPLHACLYPEDDDASPNEEAQQLAAGTDQGEEKREQPAAQPGDAVARQQQQRRRQQQPVAPSSANEGSSPISTPAVQRPTGQPVPGIFLVLVVALACLSCSTAQAADMVAGQARVIDGDTVQVGGTRVRMYGIDAPESAQTCLFANGTQYPCGQVATKVLAGRVGQEPVECEVRDVDRYGRSVAVCSQGGEDLNGFMVASGWAVAYRQFSRAYVPQEEAAKAAGLGMWQGSFEWPWDWRRQQRQQRSPSPAQQQGSAAASPAPPGVPGGAPPAPGSEEDCLVKGNINSKGDKIYHLPGGSSYEATRIDISAGERWFCSEAEATAAGWRPAGGGRAARLPAWAALLLPFAAAVVLAR